ncbi:MAG: RNA 2',3'-cyclic phosphodiesterase, partial [Nitrospinales bacterium]
METVRAFIAVDLPPFAKETVAEAQDYFKSLDLDAAWVKPGNIHLTLKFLGDIEVPKIAEIQRSVAPAVGQFPCISVSLGKVGVFPNLNRPRVLWIGLEDAATGSLESLRDTIENQLQAVGFKPELKKFSPHLTLGRIKSARGKGRLRE